MSNENVVKNYYQGIYLTETIMGNPNGDFLDNIPRNFDNHVFTTDKCIKYNVRKYLHDFEEKIIEVTDEDGQNKRTIENFVFFFPRLIEEANLGDAKFKTREDVFKYFDGKCDFENLLKNSPDIRMFGGTFSFSKSDKNGGGKQIEPHQIYGPIQLSYGIDINESQIKKLQIGSPFADGESGSQTTIGSESIVDDAIISYDITINPNNHPNLLSNGDLDLFKRALWYGTNLRKSTSKKTDSKFLLLVKFKNSRTDEKVTAINIGELKELISIDNKEEHKLNNIKIELNCDLLFKKIKNYSNYIDSVELYFDSDEIKLIYSEDYKDIYEFINIKKPWELLNKNEDNLEDKIDGEEE